MTGPLLTSSGKNARTGQTLPARKGCRARPATRGGGHPIVQLAFHPIGNRNCSNVASLADQINGSPMLLALLEMIQGQGHSFMPP